MPWPCRGQLALIFSRLGLEVARERHKKERVFTVHVTEFTYPVEKGKRRKDKWLFRKVEEPIFAIAGASRATDEVAEGSMRKLGLPSAVG